ncbi:MAG: ABC transporter ATP-binding protein [Myxococcota bacterium]
MTSATTSAATREANPEVTREPLLAVHGLKVHFPANTAAIRAVDGVSFELFPGETLALVGESGCGKSTLARALVGLNRPTAGSIKLGQRELAKLTRSELRPLRKQIQLVFQDPYASLNPRLNVADTLGEAIRLHQRADSGKVAARIADLMNAVGLDPAWATRYPHEFSGGQRQRISVARALAVEPHILICDEVTSALDVSVQAQLVELLKSLQRSLGLAYLFIAHDLGVVRSIAHRVAVMYLGQIVELRPSETFFENPTHPYSQALLASVPRLRPEANARQLLRGEVPSPANPPLGCRFHPRCPARFDRCPTEAPELYPVEGGVSRCFLHDKSANG